MNPGVLQILITRAPQPHPNDPTRAVLVTNVAPRWLINGVEQECTDRAIVLSVVKEALDGLIDQVPFNPPAIVRPALVLPGSH